MEQIQTQKEKKISEKRRKLKSITLVLPTFNEEGNIIKVIKEAVTELKKTKADWELLVINDGSTDKTEELIEKNFNNEKRIKIIRHNKNKGYAAAVGTGMKHSLKDMVFAIDSDGQYSFKDIPAFIKKINEGYDIVVGWRVSIEDTLLRKFLSRCYNKIFFILFGRRFNDVDCGFRVLRKEIAKNIKIDEGSVIVGSQMFSRSLKFDFKIAELPVKHLPRKTGDTLFKLWKIPFLSSKIFLELLKLKIESLNYKLKHNKK